MRLPALLALCALTLTAQAPQAEAKPPAPQAEAKPAPKPAKSLGLVGCTESKVFHRRACKVVKAKDSTCAKVGFTWRQEATQSGYKPCEACKP